MLAERVGIAASRRSRQLRVVIRRPLALALLLACGSGCRGCAEGAREEAHEVSGPTMPVGLLVPVADGGGTTGNEPASGFSFRRGPKPAGSGWIELQIARTNDTPDRSTFERGLADSSYLSVDAAMALHDAFARALPGYDPFVPRLFDSAALARLVTELADVKRGARPELERTVEQLSALAEGTANQGRGLWVLGI